MSIQERSGSIYRGEDFFSIRPTVQDLACGKGLLRIVKEATSEHLAECEWEPNMSGSSLLTIDYEQSTNRSVADLIAEGEAQETRKVN